MSEFKVGDKVKYCDFEAKIFGIADEPDVDGFLYGVSFYNDIGQLFNRVVSENDLQKIKKGCPAWREQIKRKVITKRGQVFTINNEAWISHCPFCNSGELDENGCTNRETIKKYEEEK